MKTEVVQQLHNKDEKKVILMRKPHSPHEVVFSPDPSDNHFVNVILLKRATGQVVATHYILRSDMPSWVTMYEGDGFKTITNNEDNERK
jgi:hypothetical protein